MFLKRRDKDNDLYQRLQDQSLQMLQQFSGEVWTDYNVHDPGITILDQLHVALFDLDYQLKSTFGEFLETNVRDIQEFGLLSPEILFAPSLVTTDDYELLMKSIPEIVHCAINLNPSTSCYQIQIEACEGCDQAALQNQVETLYHEHRNLCENLGQIAFQKLEPKEYKIQIDIELAKQSLAPDYVVRNKLPYYSIQHDFPNCYGINSWGLPGNATPKRKVQALQLKGYLLIFDYLVASCIAQSDQISNLFELLKDIPKKTWPIIDIMGVEKLIDRDKFAQNTEQNNVFWHHQKSLYLDTLDKLYGENTRHISENDDSSDLSATNRKRAELIMMLPQLNEKRFRSFNLRSTETNTIIPIKKLIGLLLGCNGQEELSTVNMLKKYQLRLINDTTFFEHYRAVNLAFEADAIENFWINASTDKIPILEIAWEERYFSILREKIKILGLGLFFESLLQYGENRNSYRIIPYEDRAGYLFAFNNLKQGTWMNLGFFKEESEVILIANILFQFITMLSENSQSFYFLEHLLLSNELTESNQLSIILSKGIKVNDSQEVCEDIISARLPAHLEVHFYWLNLNEMCHFEHLYLAWRKAISIRDREHTNGFGKELKDFLNVIRTSL